MPTEAPTPEPIAEDLQRNAEADRTWLLTRSEWLDNGDMDINDFESAIQKTLAWIRRAIAAESEAAALRLELERQTHQLRRALLEYGAHAPSCPQPGGTNPCDCGWAMLPSQMKAEPIIRSEDQLANQQRWADRKAYRDGQIGR